MVSEVDEVTVAFCKGCAVPYAIDEGWQGYCPACCALVDEHRAGLHLFWLVTDCRDCRESDPEPLRDTA